MKKLVLTLSIALVSSLGFAQNYSGGSGTAADPFIISNKADLKYLCENNTDWNKFFKQSKNINFVSSDFQNGGDFYNSGNGFTSIGNSTVPFTGSYNGQNFIIDGLMCSRSFDSEVAFFGHVTTSYTIENLSVTNVSIGGLTYVGGLVGHHEMGTIKNCYSSGTIVSEGYAANLVGQNDGTILNSHSSGTVSIGGLLSYEYKMGGFVGLNNSIITDCYSTSTVNGDQETGGFAGRNSGHISNCYFSGSVSGGNAGAFTSYNDSTISNSFWNTDNCGLSGVVGGSGTGITGINTSQMQTLSTFTSVGWDFVGESTNGNADIWSMGACNTNGSYPKLTWELFSGGGGGTVSNPFTIANKYDLKTLADNSCLWNKYFVQTADINLTSEDFSSGGIFYNGGLGFSPIGDYYTTQFTGSYNGQGYKIDSLKISRSSQDHVGFFGIVWAGNGIYDVHLTNVDISAHDYTGGLIGYRNSATVSNCSVSGSVSGNQYVGGLAAYSSYGTVHHCASLCNVFGFANTVGGLIGQQYYGQIDSSYAKGTLYGSYCGGLVGLNQSANILSSYASSKIIGGGQSGGLIGYGLDGLIDNCYAISDTINGAAPTGGLIGENLGNFIISNCYASGPILSGGAGFGGLIGSAGSSGNFYNNFWNVTSSGQAIGCGSGSYTGITGITTTAMQTEATFTAATWDFAGETSNGTYDYWKMGNCVNNNGFPVLSWQTLIPMTLVNGSLSTALTQVACHGGSNGAIDLTVSGGAGSLSYSWSNSATIQDLTGLIAGTYIVIVTDTNDCQATDTAHITEPAALDVTTSTTNQTITANASGLSYQWIDCGNSNQSIAGETNQSFTTTANGTYAVIVSNGNCSDTSACVVINTVGLQSAAGKERISIYPNPSNGMFTIVGLQTGSTVEVRNTLGELVYSFSSAELSTKVDLKGNTNGIYFIRINNQTYKLVKQD